MYPHNKYAPCNPYAPEAQAICDRCGFMWHHSDLAWQFDYRGSYSLTNLRILVCPKGCMDLPQPQNQPKSTPPDPVPIKNPRPAFWAQQAGPAPPVIPVSQFLPED